MNKIRWSVESIKKNWRYGVSLLQFFQREEIALRLKFVVALDTPSYLVFNSASSISGSITVVVLVAVI